MLGISMAKSSPRHAKPTGELHLNFNNGQMVVGGVSNWRAGRMGDEFPACEPPGNAAHPHHCSSGRFVGMIVERVS